MKSLSRVRLFATLWTAAYQAPPSMEFSRQEYWSGLPFPSPEDLPNPGSNPGFLHCRQTLYCLSHLWPNIVVLEKTLESPLDSREIKPVNSKGNSSGIFTGRTDAEAKAPILWPPNVKS